MSGEPETPQTEVTIAYAVEQYLAEILGSQGSMITGYLGIVTYLNEDGENAWSFLRSGHATATGDLGMARIITKTVEAEVDRLMFSFYDDNEDHG